MLQQTTMMRYVHSYMHGLFFKTKTVIKDDFTPRLQKLFTVMTVRKIDNARYDLLLFSL